MSKVKAGEGWRGGRSRQDGLVSDSTRRNVHRNIKAGMSQSRIAHQNGVSISFVSQVAKTVDLPARFKDDIRELFADGCTEVEIAEAYRTTQPQVSFIVREVLV